MTKNSSLFRQNFKWRKVNIKFVFCVVLCSLFCVVLFSGCNSRSVSENLSNDFKNSKTSRSKKSDATIKKKNKENSSKKNSEKIQIYICGAVNNPGVYTVNNDARIIDVLNKAGGFANNASQISINLASKIKDEEKIYIPTIDEDNASNVGEQAKGDLENTSDNSGKVNLNTASKEQLMTLTGIGEAKAQKIIDYRNSNGGFKKIEDLMNITGIKEGVFNKVKDEITI